MGEQQQIGRYQIIRQLGEGGMGTVYLGQDLMLDRQVAIKTIRVPDSMTTGEQKWMRERFLNEARIVARLAHPHIVTIHDIFEHQGAMYIVMEYVDGRSLAEVLSDTPAPLVQTEFMLRALRETAAALDYAHANQVVHRDIKPANLLIDRSGTTKITDFGIAKLTGATTMTVTGTVIGTIDFMAPEQIKGDPIDGRADQFSLAVLAFRALTGRKLFEAESFISLSYKICHETPTPASTYNRDLPRGVDLVLARALAKSPVDRFRTCSEFVAALSGELSAASRGKTVVEFAPAPVPPGPPVFAKTTLEPPPVQRRPPLLSPKLSSSRPRTNVPVIVGLAVVLLGVGGYFVWRALSHGPTDRSGSTSGTTGPELPPGDTAGLIVEGRPESSPLLEATFRPVEREYFRDQHLPLLRGRSFGPGDTALTVPVAVINQELARRVWPAEDPIGRRLKRSPSNDLAPWITIVGIVADGSRGLECYVPIERASGASPPPPPPPKETPEVTKRIRVDPAVQARKLIRGVRPVYPEVAKQQRIEGDVRFTVIIAADGTVRDLQPISGPPSLIPASTDAVKQWTYKPTLVGGARVEVVTEVSVNFAGPPPITPPPPPPAKGEVRPSSPQRIRVGASVTQANLIRYVTPVYPALAKQARVQGSVRFTAIIGKDGTIQSLQLIDGHPLLVKAAEDAVKQWLYKPTLLNGEPVEIVTQIDVNFTLSQ